MLDNIGIAKDEQERLLRLGGQRLSLLDKYGCTEQGARALCESAGLLSPVYEFTDRGGCWFCPNAKKKELRHLYDHHPDLWARMLELQRLPNKCTERFNRSDRFSDIDERFRQEYAQLRISELPAVRSIRKEKMMSNKKPSLFDRAETVAKWETENEIPPEQRMTEWYGDYALYEPRLGVSEAQIMQKYREITQRPQMELAGQDGNVFAIMGRASRLLKDAGQPDQADEMFQRVTASGSYDEALQIISEYVATELSAPTEAPPQKLNPKKKKENKTYER